MARLLALALLSAAALPASALAQYEQRPMPVYRDVQEAPPPPGGGYSDRIDSGDARTDEAVQAYTPPPSGPVGAHWKTPKPYARKDQVDEGRPDDDAHQLDRAYTAELNHRRWPNRNAPPPPPASSPDRSYAASADDYHRQLAEHQQEMQQYRAEQARYANRIAQWRARADACEHGDTYACEGPQ